MTSINLVGNNIGGKGAASLAAAMEKNYALEALHFHFPDSMQEHIDQLLARNIARYPQWRNSVMGWMWASKNLHVRLPRDVALMIAKMIWKTRTMYKSLKRIDWRQYAVVFDMSRVQPLAETAGDEWVNKCIERLKKRTNV